jgi:hypothetical protein
VLLPAEKRNRAADGGRSRQARLTTSAAANARRERRAAATAAVLDYGVMSWSRGSVPAAGVTLRFGAPARQPRRCSAVSPAWFGSSVQGGDPWQGFGAVAGVLPCGRHGSGAVAGGGFELRRRWPRLVRPPVLGALGFEFAEGQGALAVVLAAELGEED